MSVLQIVLSEDVIEKLRAMARSSDEPVETFIAKSLSESVSARERFQAMRKRGQNVTRERVLEILRKAPNVPPMPGDEIEP